MIKVTFYLDYGEDVAALHYTWNMEEVPKRKQYVTLPGSAHTFHVMGGATWHGPNEVYVEVRLYDAEGYRQFLTAKEDIKIFLDCGWK